MNIFLFVLGIALIIGIGCFWWWEEEDGRDHNIKLSIIGVIVGIALIIFSDSFKIIPTGYTGVRTTFGQIDSETVSNGFNWKVPFVQRIKKVNNKQQDVSFNGQIWSETKERTAIYYDKITVSFQIDVNSSAWIYANITNYKTSLLNKELVNSAIKASSKELSDTDATNRAIIEPLVLENLQESLNEKYGEGVVWVVKVTIGDTDFEESYKLAIAEKQQAQLAAEQQEIENQKEIDKAKAEAEVKKTIAEGEAKAKLIGALAEADANRTIQQSLTDNILDKQWIEKWDGKLPVYSSGKEGSFIFSMPN